MLAQLEDNPQINIKDIILYLGDEQHSNEDKLRLFIIYYMQQYSISDEEVLQLEMLLPLDSIYINAINYIKQLKKSISTTIQITNNQTNNNSINNNNNNNNTFMSKIGFPRELKDMFGNVASTVNIYKQTTHSSYIVHCVTHIMEQPKRY